jgi:Putative porin
MRPFVILAILMILLQTGYCWAQEEKGDSDRIRQLEEELGKMQDEQDRLQKALEEMKKNQQLTIPSAKEPSKFPVKFGVNLDIRYAYQRVADKTDVLIDPNETNGFRARVRFSAEYNQNDRLAAGLRISTGENPNPAGSFIVLGDTFRSKTFNLDQFFIVYRPLESFQDLSFTVGKMPLPFWRGDRGTWRTQMIWDNDISPEGIALQTSIPSGLPFLRIDNAGGYFIVNEVPNFRFTGLTGDTYLIADQVKFKTEPVTVAAAVYDYRHLNAGLRAPNFDPNTGAFISPGTNALLMQDGLQQTNNRVNYGPGADGFVNEEFLLINFTGQAHISIPTSWLEPIGLAFLEPEVFLAGDYVHNRSVALDKNGYGITGGLRGGGKGVIQPFNLWYTYRDVDADATLAALADSDLGAGTDYKGFELGMNYLLQHDLMIQFILFEYDGYPQKDNSVTRWYLDLVKTF